jgi:argininosuccinate synthase
MLEDPECPAPESMFKMTVSPEAAPDKPEVMQLRCFLTVYTD